MLSLKEAIKPEGSVKEGVSSVCRPSRLIWSGAEWRAVLPALSKTGPDSLVPGCWKPCFHGSLHYLGKEEKGNGEFLLGKGVYASAEYTRNLLKTLLDHSLCC